MFDSFIQYHYKALLAIALIFGALIIIFKNRRSDRRKPPLAPDALPILGHSKLFLKDLTKLASIISNSTNPEKFLRFRFPFDDLWVARGSSHIINILSDPKTFDFGPMKSMVLRRILGLLGEVVKVANNDDSGVGSKPLPNTNVPPHKRFNYLEHKATQDFSRPSSHAAFVHHFEENLYYWVEHCEITADAWVTFPDLYTFTRDVIFRTTTDAFFGPHLLQQNPSLAKDIWTFDENVPFLAKGLPNFLNPKAANARTRCRQAFKNWRDFALKGRIPPNELPEWNEVSGLKCMSLRNLVFEQFEEWAQDENSCAASDFAVLFGLTSNIVRATFWFFLETLQSKHDLLPDATNEILRATNTTNSPEANGPPRFTTDKLLSMPLLQSIYAETLRKYVSVLMVRQTRREAKVGSWKIPLGQKVPVCNYSEHMNEQLWNPEGVEHETSTGGEHPISKFWGRRFVRYKGAERRSKAEDHSKSGEQTQATAAKFSTEGLRHKWFPFGFGERICPGRQFAKHQMLLTFALFSRVFDIELMVAEGWKPGPDIQFFGYGIMPPEEKTPFRIRKRRG
ncbi:hypothetical protein G7Y89_g7433 [Cudoniella acicularis]|uniref:Cytochrome P450 n=1 Tax=Cudoniella acicularis TaxID=354080 RepID=A0A8H4RL72_9HELO|nr:hypothetical protein G7Y89_g7433 [Cudoniella acicularis]